MKNCKLLVLPLCFLVLAGCGTRKANQKILSPVLALNEARNGLTWGPVDGAVSYSISVNDEEPVTVTTPGYEFATEAGAYTVKVVANASDASKNSDASEFEYSTLYTVLGNLSSTSNVITWENYAGTGLEYTVNGGTPIEVQGSSIMTTTSGMYTVRSLGGFIDENHKYYVDNGLSIHERTIMVQFTQSEGIMLEDGEYETDTDLQERYVAKKYDDNSGWIDTSASINLETENPFSTGKCVKANIWHHGKWFKWTRAMNCTGRVETIHFFLKGNAATRFALSFDITEDLVMGGMNLKGVYATYMLQPAPQNWTEYTIDTDDARWTINFNGQSYTFAAVQSLLAGLGYNIQSVGDFFPYFGTYSIKALGEYLDGGPTTYLLFDDLSLGVQPVATTIADEKFDVTAGTFAFQSSGINAGLFMYNPEGLSKLQFRQGPNLEEVTVTTSVSQTERTLTLTATKAGFSFVAKLSSQDCGESFTLVNVTGELASFLADMRLDRCQVLYDFEKFTSTGVGHDQSHTDPNAWSGLRKEFYSDYYSGGSGSAIGGSGWSMMGSSDYLELSTSVAHTGEKSMRLKYNKGNQMRFLTYGLAVEGGEAYSKGTYLSMWVRANSSRDNVIKLKAFYINYVEPATQNQCTEVEVTIPRDENHGWVEVKLPLKAAKSYYGFAILPMKENGDASEEGKYFYVDDIAIVNSISPFTNPTE